MGILSNPNSKSIFVRAIEKFGITVQLFVLCEEVGELMQAISKSVRGNKSEATIRNIMEEMIDVEIMLEQLKIIYNFDKDDLEWMRLRKINRLEKRIKG